MVVVVLNTIRLFVVDVVVVQGTTDSMIKSNTATTIH